MYLEKKIYYKAAFQINYVSGLSMWHIYASIVFSEMLCCVWQQYTVQFTSKYMMKSSK